MFNILNIFLILAFLSTIAVTFATREPTGPQGAMGLWPVFLIPCLFAAVILFSLAAKKLLNITPGGRLIQFIVAAGILITFSTAIIGTIDRQNYNWIIQGLVIIVPSLILAGCTVIIHETVFPNPRFFYWTATIFLCTVALTGWGVAGKGLFNYIKTDMAKSAQRAQEDKIQEEQNKQWEANKFAALDDSASLYAFLQFIYSRNERVRQQARKKVMHFPGLDNKLIELIDLDCTDAISYIAKLYENPPAKFAPAWGRMLKRQLNKNNSLQYNEHAGIWEPNLKVYFEGAEKIQLAGGSLQTELALWHRHLVKCKGLENLAAFVKNLLEKNS